MADDDLPDMSGDTTPTPTQPTDQASRIAEALQRVQNGEKLEDLIGDYADLIPPQFAGMAPALLGMLGGMKGGEWWLENFASGLLTLTATGTRGVKIFLC